MKMGIYISDNDLVKVSQIFDEGDIREGLGSCGMSGQKEGLFANSVSQGEIWKCFCDAHFSCRFLATCKGSAPVYLHLYRGDSLKMQKIGLRLSYAFCKSFVI